MNCDGENSEGKTLANLVSLVTVASAGHFVDMPDVWNLELHTKAKDTKQKFQIFIQMEGSN